MTRTTRFLVVLAVGIVVATLAPLAVYAAILRMPVKEVEVGTTPIVVAARPILFGTLLTRDDVKLVAWPAKFPLEGGFNRAAQALNFGFAGGTGRAPPVAAGCFHDQHVGVNVLESRA